MTAVATEAEFKYTRRQYMIMRCLQRDETWADAVASVDKTLRIGVLDPDERRTYREWEGRDFSMPTVQPDGGRLAITAGSETRTGELVPTGGMPVSPEAEGL